MPGSGARVLLATTHCADVPALRIGLTEADAPLLAEIGEALRCADALPWLLQDSAIPKATAFCRPALPSRDFFAV